MKLSGVFFIIALLASYFGFTTLSTDLSTISDNTFIGFVITVNERIIEAFKRTFRRRTAEPQTSISRNSTKLLNN